MCTKIWKIFYFCTMKRIIFFLCLSFLCLSCSDDEDDGGSATKHSLRRVVLVYMMAENSLSSYATDDLREIRAGMDNIPSDCRMVVYFDNSDANTWPEIISFDAENGERLVYEYPEDVISTDGDVMLAALRRMLQSNDADEYALILWSHASGWIPSSNKAPQRTIGIDNGKNTTSNTGTEMEISMLKSVLETLGIHWTYIFYDACFMQCVEVAYELRQLTDWSIGSVAEIPANGAPYDLLMADFFDRTGYADNIIKDYYNYYRNSSGVLLSSIESSGLDALADATKQVISPLTDFPTADIQKYCAYSSNTLYKPEYFDIGSCVYHWTGDDGYNAWDSAMGQAIPYRYYSDTWATTYRDVTARMTDAAHYTGVSMYFPIAGRDELNEAWQQYEWAKYVFAGK